MPANWGERLVAYIIDVIILSIFLTPLRLISFWSSWPAWSWGPESLRWMPFVSLGWDNIVHFLYWTFLEGSYGQSIGKMIMKIKVTRLNGEPVDIIAAAIESIGKSFVLVLDCLAGWILYPQKNQRLFNYISGTIVTKTSI
jgi:uncharacterized RDD family membrane protein YckC